MHDALLGWGKDTVQRYVETAPTGQVVRFKSPAAIAATADLSLPREAGAQAAAIERVKAAVSDALEHSVVTLHPLFLGTLVQGNIKPSPRLRQPLAACWLPGRQVIRRH
jgi:hypothetical protein